MITFDQRHFSIIEVSEMFNLWLTGKVRLQYRKHSTSDWKDFTKTKLKRKHLYYYDWRKFHVNDI